MLKHSVPSRIDRIILHNVCPAVFSDNEVSSSELWLKEFSFERGKHYLIEAGSGSGKSSLCSFIYRNRSDFRGDITFDDRNAKGLTIKGISDLRLSHIALLPQELRLFPELSVIENITLKNRLTDHVSEEKIFEILSHLGIRNKADAPAGKLSIGQMQRVAIARSLCQPFDFILLDEPVSHLDEHNNRLVTELILNEAAAQQASIITTSVGNKLLLPDDQTIRIRL